MMMKGNEEVNVVAVGEETKSKEDVVDDGVRDNLDKDMEVQTQNKHKKQFVRLDSLDQEASHISGMETKTTKALSIAAVMKLAFQSIGVVYGDIGTSPLYVFASTFTERVPTSDNIIGALSLIIYSLTLFPLIKYVFIVLRANDNGDGGTFAMYSLICRHSKVSAIPSSQQGEDEMNLSAYQLQIPTKHLKRAEKIKAALERSSFAKTALLIVALLGTCMVIGDGILTPCISVLSAVDGVRKFDSHLETDVVVMISVAILVVLFSIQRFGTDKVGYTFAPAIMVWYLFIGGVGIFNLIRHDSSVLRAFNPVYIFWYFNDEPKQAWLSLGGVVLCMTGTEAMFADLGHFSVRSIQIAFTGLVYPCLLCAYVGQAAYLSKFPNHVSDAFYKSTPEPVYWPMFVVAVIASIIASQAMISATFSIVKQSMALGCFPRVRVVHTSHKHEGQVYIPEINFFLMFACTLVTASFKETTKIGNAYGIAVMAVMLVTTSLLVLIMLMIWQTSLFLVALFILIFGSFELLYFSSVLYKFTKGGYLPLTFAAAIFFVMYVWHYVQVKRYAFEVEKKVSTEYLISLGSGLGITRVPGVGLLYTELTQGIPAIFSHFLTNLPAIHSVLIFVSVKYLPVNNVPANERLLLRRVGPKDYKMYRCIARYGYKDRRIGNEEFENLLMESLKTFIREENGEDNIAMMGQEWEEEIQFLETSRSHGVIYMLGHSEVRASVDSCLVKKVVVDYVYDFLRRNFRQGFVDLQIPNKNLLQVGMNYHI
ncbi:potassium transporter 5-like isoform X1 [Telopea speciosissima]|uniref:potassium transporter 5-like isoform X1 n=1 Tax=Telopea speciosissima TaxID=54955 RepID=UPI001CC7E1E3|nr:potassium transporter 5-like isoform X1 [Telopea speciosissima]XP_043722074.1 potassium transporter 5-like isoform X1 [Telopea speciosissima]